MDYVSESAAFQVGQRTATITLSDRPKLATLSSTDRLSWWLGFLSTATGTAVCELGESDAQALCRTLLAGSGYFREIGYVPDCAESAGCS